MSINADDTNGFLPVSKDADSVSEVIVSMSIIMTPSSVVVGGANVVGLSVGSVVGEFVCRTYSVGKSVSAALVEDGVSEGESELKSLVVVVEALLLVELIVSMSTIMTPAAAVAAVVSSSCEEEELGDIVPGEEEGVEVVGEEEVGEELGVEVGEELVEEVGCEEEDVVGDDVVGQSSPKLVHKQSATSCNATSCKGETAAPSSNATISFKGESPPPTLLPLLPYRDSQYRWEKLVQKFESLKGTLLP
mmetsp:Transcript_53594/g.61879  ORF Transcript_53594/g.61879 Transcript_53594/m.61879 type:complete len:248 (+) Transcript_53594:635-1378(+)